MIRRTSDPSFLDTIINDPSVRGVWALEGHLSVADFLNDPAFLAYEAEGGGFLFQEVLPNIFTVHIAFKRGTSSKAVRQTCRQMMEILFQEVGAEALHAKIESWNYVTTRLARHLGFRSMTVREEHFNGKFQKVEHLALTKEMWRPN